MKGYFCHKQHDIKPRKYNTYRDVYKPFINVVDEWE